MGCKLNKGTSLQNVLSFLRQLFLYVHVPPGALVFLRGHKGHHCSKGNGAPEEGVQDSAARVARL